MSLPVGKYPSTRTVSSVSRHRAKTNYLEKNWLVHYVANSSLCSLPKHFFLNNFLQKKASSSVESKTSPYEVCGDDEESESEVQNVASVYCVECQMKLCHICEQGSNVIKSIHS